MKVVAVSNLNKKISYEAYIPELVNTEIIESVEPFYMGYYCNPMVEFGVHRQMPAGLIDEVAIYEKALAPMEVRSIYNECLNEDGTHPVLEFSEVALDSSVYLGDRYRPQYHAIPPAVWMNEPHSPFYYNGNFTYDFYGYYIDDLVAEPQAAADGIYLDL